MGLEVLDAATKKKTLVSRSRPVIGHVPRSTGKEARQSCEEDTAGGGSADAVLAKRMRACVDPAQAWRCASVSLVMAGWGEQSQAASQRLLASLANW